MLGEWAAAKGEGSLDRGPQRVQIGTIMKQPVPDVTMGACHSEGGDAGVRNARVCEGEAVLPESV